MSAKRRQQLLYDPRIQLEELPERLELPYQRLIAFLAKCLPGALAVFAAITAFEAASGQLAGLAGRAWIDKLGRAPSAIGGQGNLSANAMIAMLQARAKAAPLKAVISGDSVFAPNLGGGSGNEMSLEDAAGSQVPGALNISQEGGEWATNALMIERMEQEPEVQAEKPLLVFDVNFKFFGTQRSFSPAFPVEMELCAERLAKGDPICEMLAEDWPDTLSAIARFSPALTRGILGQFDFLMTFVQRAPIYEANVRGFGFHPYRTLLSGLADGRTIASDFRAASPAIHYQYIGREARMNNYLWLITHSFQDPAHRKHAWIRELADAVSRWPGPVLGFWISPSPEALSVSSVDERRQVDEMGTKLMSIFSATGKKDLRMVSSASVLTDAFDYGDSDHPSPQGHRKLAQTITAALDGRMP